MNVDVTQAKPADTDKLIEAANAELRSALPASAAKHAAMLKRPRLGTSRSRFWPIPIYVDHAQGAHLEDVDGRDYIDCNMGHGPLVLGHAHPVVLEAIYAQLERGTHYGPPSPQELELAEIIVAGIPGAERVAFTNSGGESTMAAVRIARQVTGRQTIAKFEGGLHGNYDPLLFGVFSTGGPVEHPEACPDSGGLPPGTASSVVMLPFNDETAIERVRSEGSAWACVIIEPVQGSAGCLPTADGYLQRLREACDEVGTLLILDEVITAFRLGPGAAAPRYGIAADLTTMGKAIGGGLPVGAVAGRGELIDCTNAPPGGGSGKGVFIGGTFSGNPLSAAAGAAQLGELIRDPSHYERLDALGSRMRSGLRKTLADLGVTGFVTGVGSMWGGPYFTPKAPERMRDIAAGNQLAARLLSTYLILDGVLMTSPPHLNFVSSSHTEAEVDQVVGAHRRALERLKAEGVL